MKKLVSMLLVVAMVLSLGVVSFAAEPTYDDYLKEATQVVNDLGIMVGEGDGDIKPDTLLTREEMFVIMYSINSKLGGKMSKTNIASYNAIIPAVKTMLNDVDTASDWAKPYLAYAFTENIFAGNGKGINPKGNLSVIECTVVLLRALGYTDKDDIHANCNHDKGVCNWYNNTVMLGLKAKLFANLATQDYNSAITRGDIAIMICNMFRSTIKGGADNGLKKFFGESEFKNLYTTVFFSERAALTEDLKVDGKVIHKKGTEYYTAYSDVELLALEENRFYFDDYGFNGSEFLDEYTWATNASGTPTCAPRSTGNVKLVMGERGDFETTIDKAVLNSDNSVKTHAKVYYGFKNGSKIELDNDNASMYIYSNLSYAGISANVEGGFVTFEDATEQKIKSENYIAKIDQNKSDIITIRYWNKIAFVSTYNTYFGYLAEKDGVYSTAESGTFYAYKLACAYDKDFNREISVVASSVEKIEPVAVKDNKITLKTVFNDKFQPVTVPYYGGKQITYTLTNSSWGVDEDAADKLMKSVNFANVSKDSTKNPVIYIYEGNVVNAVENYSETGITTEFRPVVLLSIDEVAGNLSYVGYYLDDFTLFTLTVASNKIIAGKDVASVSSLADLQGQVLSFEYVADIDDDAKTTTPGYVINDLSGFYDTNKIGYITQYVNVTGYSDKIALSTSSELLSKTIGSGDGKINKVEYKLGESEIKNIVGGDVNDPSKLQGFILRTVDKGFTLYVVPYTLIVLLSSNIK